MSVKPNPSVKGICLRQAPYVERYAAKGEM